MIRGRAGSAPTSRWKYRKQYFRIVQALWLQRGLRLTAPMATPLTPMDMRPHRGPAPAGSPAAVQVSRPAVNYMYDNRYGIDLVYTLSGASAFGSNKRYKPFYSAGASWNINREDFFRDDPTHTYATQPPPER